MKWKKCPKFEKYASWFGSGNTWFELEAFWLELRTKSDSNQMAPELTRFLGKIIWFGSCWRFDSNQIKQNQPWFMKNEIDLGHVQIMIQIKSDTISSQENDKDQVKNIIRIKFLSWATVQFDHNHGFSVKLSDSN